MKKTLTLVLVFSIFFFVLIFYFKKQKENIGMVQNEPERNAMDSLPSSLQDNGIINEDLLRPKKTPEESIPVEEEKEVITLSKPTVTDEIRGEEDSNGVRHDVNLWIAEQSITYEQKLALIQQARVMQADLVNAERISQLDIENGRKEAEKLAVNTIRSMKCILKKFKSEKEPFLYSEALEKLILNTPLRNEASAQIDHALSGAAIVSPQGDPCDE